jgi:hypothetical protein
MITHIRPKVGATRDVAAARLDEPNLPITVGSRPRLSNLAAARLATT